MRAGLGIMAGAMRDARGSWRTLAWTDLAYRLLAFALLTPATIGLLHWAMSRAGADVVADTEIATFFLTTRQGLLALVICGAMLLAITALEMACLMAIGVAAAAGERLTVRGAVAFGAARAGLVFRLALHMVTRLLAGLIPFVLAIGVVYWALLRHHDINFYLATRPPAFGIAVGLAALILAALVALLVRTIARWSLALPLVLFEDVSPRRALAESARRSVPVRRLAVSALTVWALLALALVTLVTWAPHVVGRRLAPAFGSSVEQLVLFITALAILWGALAIAATITNALLLAMVFVRLYMRSGPPAGLRVAGAAPCGARAVIVKLPAVVSISAVITIVLAVGALTLLIVNATRRNQPVVVIAHRGASATAPENTLAAFRVAADQRADFVELDVQESADGEVMVVHDSDLMKVGRSPLKIWEASSADLRAVDIGSHKHASFSAERVPTLAEALALCKGRVRVIVELKTYGHGQRLVERVIDIVDASGVADLTVFMSLDHDLVRQLKRLRPAWRVGALAAKAMGDLTAIGADFLAVEAGVATRAMVRQAHRAGQDVYVWTVNDPVRMLRAMSNGVDGLITDKPEAARRVVERRSRMSDAQRILAALLVAVGATSEELAAEEALQRR